MLTHLGGYVNNRNRARADYPCAPVWPNALRKSPGVRAGARQTNSSQT